ncbi:CLC_0170 family protein [Dethiothermospora halolimnae]|uniref:CLC_0170 family protein n=1 Tax=Dethiothermospora halolimnae TaxID=3114390 RepID=UPI003CCC1B95
MNIFYTAIEQLRDICNIYWLFFIVLIGLFTFFIDGNYFKNKKSKKEEKLARIIGLIYIIAGPVIFTALKLL